MSEAKSEECNPGFRCARSISRALRKCAVEQQCCKEREQVEYRKAKEARGCGAVTRSHQYAQRKDNHRRACGEGDDAIKEGAVCEQPRRKSRRREHQGVGHDMPARRLGS